MENYLIFLRNTIMNLFSFKFDQIGVDFELYIQGNAVGLATFVIVLILIFALIGACVAMIIFAIQHGRRSKPKETE